MKKILAVTFLIIITAVGGAMSAQASSGSYYDGRPRCGDNPGGTCS